jgi:Intron-binding protein aquarius N-terminus
LSDTVGIWFSYPYTKIHCNIWQILDSKVMLLEPAEDSMEDQVDESCVLYCERFTEFLIDLLSQLPTRR